VRLHPLALAAAVPWISACGADDCETLCVRAAKRVDVCLESWGAVWQDLGSESQRDWRIQCEDDWAATRADLEPREVQLAVDACSDTLPALARMTCDDLESLYL
jgi:hypothetical protein